jgi:predicted nucleic acid-binding protein
MSNPILIDASYLYAIYNPKDKHHKAAIAFAQEMKNRRLSLKLFCQRSLICLSVI